MQGINLEREQTQQDAYHMRDFLGSQAWDIYKRYLEAMSEDWTRRMVAGDASQFDQFKGVLVGLKLALDCPANIIRLGETTK